MTGRVISKKIPQRKHVIIRRSRMVWTTYKEKVKRLSQRIVDAQKPIRILDAVKWDPSIEQELRKSKFKSIPKVDAEYYQKAELGFDADFKLSELADIANDTV